MIAIMSFFILQNVSFGEIARTVVNIAMLCGALGSLPCTWTDMRTLDNGLSLEVCPLPQVPLVSHSNAAEHYGWVTHKHRHTSQIQRFTVDFAPYLPVLHQQNKGHKHTQGQSHFQQRHTHTPARTHLTQQHTHTKHISTHRHEINNNMFYI